MSAINWLLVNGGDAALWLWAGVKHALTEAWHWVDPLVNPVLSPLFAVLNPVCTAIGDAVYAPLAALPSWLGLTLLSVIGGIVMLLAFRYASNQAGIGRAKDDIKANLLALKLFKDDLRVTFQSQWRILWAILRLQRYVLTPVILLTLPMLLGLAQMGIRHQWRPLMPGEQTNIRMSFAPDATELQAVTLEPSMGIDIEVGPIPGDGDLVWRVRAAEPGRHTLQFRVGDQTIEKELVVGTGCERVSATRTASAWATQLLHPAEPRLPSDLPISAIAIAYPSVDSIIHGANYWVIYLFVISMATALILKPLFKVRF